MANKKRGAQKGNKNATKYLKGFEQITVKVPLGTKQKIKAITECSITEFVNKAIKHRLELFELQETPMPYSDYMQEIMRMCKL